MAKRKAISLPLFRNGPRKAIPICARAGDKRILEQVCATRWNGHFVLLFYAERHVRWTGKQAVSEDGIIMINLAPSKHKRKAFMRRSRRDKERLASIDATIGVR